MQFHEYELMKTFMNDDYPSVSSMSNVEFYSNIINEIENGLEIKDLSSTLLAEGRYVRCRRPFYNIYPAVQGCLENTKLNFKLSQIGKIDEAIAMCFAVGKEPVVSGTKFTSMIVELMDNAKCVCCKTNGHHALRVCAQTIKSDGTKGIEGFEFSDNESFISDRLHGGHCKLVSIAVGVSLLAQDERFAEPILLKRDQGKQLNEEQLKRAIERAKNRGRNGIAIGKGLEVSPHIRKPHFAVRWTGKGGNVPRLVPVKGCVVSRDKLFPVPTGHLDD